MAEPDPCDPVAAVVADGTPIDTGIAAFEACDRPEAVALAAFIERHAAQMTGRQRQAVQRLVTWPVRGPERMGADLGLTALTHLPESEEIAAMWSRWIRGGAFDGEPCAPAELARYLAEAHRHRVAGRERLDEALRTHVRSALRSGDVSRINTALTHLEVCARAGAPNAAVLLAEARRAPGSAEWKAWSDREPDLAARMRAEVEQVADDTARRIAAGTCGAG
jgi:hypothetical protein